MKYLVAAGLMCAFRLLAADGMSAGEQQALEKALAETSNSASEIVRVLDRHLQKFPQSPERAALERTLVKSAIEADDRARILEYGQRVLSRDPDQPQILEKVAGILLEQPDGEAARKALDYAKKFEAILRALERQGPSSKRNRARMLEELERALGRALLLQARAAAVTENASAALELARKSFAAYPGGGAAREIARLEEKAGKPLDAVRWYALAFASAEMRGSAEDRAALRSRMAELYKREKGSEAGLGDLVLEAWDRMATEHAKLRAKAKERDPNADVEDPMEFTLSAVEGSPLHLAKLRGKVVVLDFWATWCGPCRIQHPLYEQVAAKFQKRDDVVFLAVNTDEDPSVVKPFLEKAGWKKGGYLEDGLSQLLRVSSIPTTVVIGKRGQIISRMNGFVPERFVDQLTGIISEALSEPK
ncbi:MAG TPA: TlpA disulfide reductase family protein [Bryobacteraceae bacterium]|nr:TlpA disulfide reductase family protein [Bryobacteraceae bacterium]